MTMSRQAIGTDQGLTQASSVIPLVRVRDAAFATVTIPFWNVRPAPKRPAAVRVTPAPSNPTFLFPDASSAVAPLGSSKPYAATRPCGWAATARCGALSTSMRGGLDVSEHAYVMTAVQSDTT